MPLIVDANTAALVFTPQPSDDFRPVHVALFTGVAVAVYGGKLAREYAAMRKHSRLLAELDRNGTLQKVSDADVDRATQRVCNESCCTSNDEHIIALARISRVRLLCSNDQDLHNDFTNPKILRPAGHVYQRPAHRHLIREHCAGDRR
jgi:hypothetical protein